MSHESDLTNAGTGFQPLQRLGKLLTAKAQSIHSGVELDPHRESSIGCGKLEQFDLFELVNDEFEMRGSGLGKFFVAEDTFEQQNRPVYSRCTERQALTDPCDTEGIG